MNLTRRVVLLLVSVLPVVPAAFAQTYVFNDLGNSIDEYSPVTSGLYGGFTTGSSPSTLSSVSLFLSNGFPSFAGSATVALYASSPGPVVGSQLTVCGTIDGTTISTNGQIVPVSCTYPLAANTTYFIGMTTTSSTYLDWLATYEPSGTGVSGQVSCLEGPNSCGSDTAGDALLMAVAVTPQSSASVPAVSPWGLAALALLMLATPFCLRRRSLRNFR